MSRKKNDFYNFFIGFMFFLIPMAPIFSNVVLYFIGLLNFFFLVLGIIRHGFKFKITSFEILYFLFVVWNIFSLKWSISDDKYVIKYGVLYFVMVVSAVRLYLFANEDMPDVKNDLISFFAKWFVCGTILISIICILYENPFSANSVRLGTYVFREPYGTRMMYTYNLEIAIFVLMFKFFKEKMINKKILYGLGSLFMAICIFLSGTRKILLGIVFYGIVYILLENKKKIYKIIPKLLTAIVLFLMLYIIIIKVPFFYNLLGSRVESGINYMFGNAGVDYSIRDRNIMIDYGILKFKEKPMIGNGTNSFHTMFYYYYGQNLYSHNTFVEILCDVGIIGFVLYYGIYLLTIFKYHNDKYSNMIMCSLLTLLLLDWWTITYYRIYFMLFLELSAIYFQKPKIKNEDLIEEQL